MAKKLSADKWLFAVTVALVLSGVIMVFSASAVLANEKFHSPLYFLLRQGVWAFLGLAGMAMLMHVDHRQYRRPLLIYTGLFVCAVLLVAVFFVDKNHNTHRWFRLGAFSFQPSELSKLFIVAYLAFFLEKRMGQINDWRHTLLPCLVVVLPFVGLIVAEPDLGTSVCIATVAFIVLFTAGLRYSYAAGVVLSAIPVLFGLVYFFPYRLKRVLVFLDPWKDPLDAGFQITQSLIALGSGGLFGLGLMEGKQKLFFLPEPHTDFIFSVIGEERGLAGTVAILLLFAVFLWRGLRLSLRAPDPFGRYLGVGLTMMIACQAFINMSVVMSLLPTKGIPLPFISSGGSSLLISLLGVGVLLNISQHGREA
ncbi:MAG: putative lipid II flippase FtsW [Acidobacteria bacterium]|nr:putative lipid II flippase FtsW [Acidobacteriota bacterium]MCI0621496.1 putative lipid II flippase FtsW [Acidobacteriota bacterium]MCI0720132.1 putative lipid II flippase FtsW [Acidobacteriota bacterium]